MGLKLKATFPRNRFIHSKAKNDPKTNDLEELISRALRGKLSAEEQVRFEQRLQQDGGLRQRFEEEKALERLLDQVPPLPVPSNFTALVLRAVREDQRKAVKSGPRSWWRFSFARVAAGLAVVVAAGFFAIQQYREAELEQMTRSVSAFAEVTSAINSEKTPSIALLQDFDAIQKLPQDGELDLELLANLQR